jgi:hypothetical protein
MRTGVLFCVVAVMAWVNSPPAPIGYGVAAFARFAECCVGMAAKSLSQSVFALWASPDTTLHRSGISWLRHA